MGQWGLSTEKVAWDGDGSIEARSRYGVTHFTDLPAHAQVARAVALDRRRAPGPVSLDVQVQVPEVLGGQGPVEDRLVCRDGKGGGAEVAAQAVWGVSGVVGRAPARTI